MCVCECPVRWRHGVKRQKRIKRHLTNGQTASADDDAEYDLWHQAILEAAAAHTLRRPNNSQVETSKRNDVCVCVSVRSGGATVSNAKKE